MVSLRIAAAWLSAAAPIVAAVPTWSGDVRPILETHCVSCHRPGGVGPPGLDLTVYGSDTGTGARRWASEVARTTAAGTMPPWPADERFDDLLWRRRLSRRQIETLAAWAAAGAPSGPTGERRSEPARRSQRSGLGTPDLLLRPQGECEIGPGARSVRLELERSPDGDRWITGLELIADDAHSVRRVLATLAPPSGGGQVILVTGSDGELRARDLPAGPRPLVQWLPGDRPALYPDAAGRRLPSAARVWLDVELLPGEGEPCRRAAAALALMVATPRQEIDLWVESGRVDAQPIATGRRRRRDPLLRGDVRFDEDVSLLTLSPAAGDGVDSFHVELRYGDGRSVVLLLVPDHDPRTAMSYPLREPLVVPAGATLRLEGRPAPTPHASAASGPRLSLHVDYMLRDHLITEAPELPSSLLAGLGYRGWRSPAESAGAPAAADRSSFLLPDALLFRADNGYHVLEGTIPAPGVFRLRVGDDQGRPLDPRNFAGDLVFEYLDAPTGTYAQSRTTLRSHRSSLWGRVPAELPLRFRLELWLAGSRRRFDFEFVEPAAGRRLRRAGGSPLEVPVPLQIDGSSAGVRRELLAAARQHARRLSSALPGPDWDVVRRAGGEIWRLALAYQDAVIDLPPEERSRMRLDAGELVYAAVGLCRNAEAERSQGLAGAAQRLAAALDRLTQSAAAAGPQP